MSYGKVVFGDNQFLGVNHANQAKAIELYERFKNPDAILEVLASAYGTGIRDFMFTTHERYEPVFDEIRRSNLFPGMFYTPCIPYAHKYWNRMSNRGPAVLLASAPMQNHPFRLIPITLGILFGHTRSLTHYLTQLELLTCKGLPLRGVFLLNAAFDLLMSMGLYKIIEEFHEIVVSRYGALPGFITMNHPLAVEVLCDKIGLQSPWLCSNYNQAGFRMNPSKVECENSFASRRTKNIAMSIFSFRAGNANDALHYVASHMKSGAIDSVLFGSSNWKNIQVNHDFIVGNS